MGVRYVIIDTSSMIFGLASSKSAIEAVAREFPTAVPMISKGIINELNKISQNKSKRGASAKAALADARARHVVIDGSQGYPDTWICAAAARDDVRAVITNDSALARELVRLGANVFRMSRNGMLSHVLR